MVDIYLYIYLDVAYFLRDTDDRWDPKPKTNIFCQTWDARTMIQINLTKFPIQISYKIGVTFAIFIFLGKCQDLLIH